jgi:hypothetical protein
MKLFSFLRRRKLLACGMLFILLPVLLLGSVVLVSVTYEIFGYHSLSYDGEKIAHLALAKGDPTECGKIRVVWHPATNTYNEVRYCVYTYAKLTQDPTACELLMPSEYGVRCIAEVWSAALIEPLCQSDDHTLFCYEKKDAEGHVIGNIQEQPKPLLDNCDRLIPQAAKEWCITRKVFEGNSDSCVELLPQSQAHDECLHTLAFRKKESSLCQEIHNFTVRSACVVRIKMAKKYPELMK